MRGLIKRLQDRQGTPTGSETFSVGKRHASTGAEGTNLNEDGGRKEISGHNRNIPPGMVGIVKGGLVIKRTPEPTTNP